MSGLAQIILDISHPAGRVMFQAPHQQLLFRRHRLFESLLAILSKWDTGARPPSHKILVPAVVIPSLEVESGTLLDHASTFMKFMIAHPCTLPLEGFPTSAFCLCSSELLQQALKSWLLAGLEALHYPDIVRVQMPGATIYLTAYCLDVVEVYHSGRELFFVL
jgi:hypothetical protein